MGRFLLLTILSLPVYAQVDVPTQRNDNARSALNARETILRHDNVRTKFGKLWSLYSDAKIMAQPLYVSNLVAPAAGLVSVAAKSKCPTGCNVVLFASMKGTVYVYLADRKPAPPKPGAREGDDTLVWARYLSDNSACQCPAAGPRDGSGDFDMWAVDDPWWGILGTPVIDRNTNSVFVVAWTNDDQYRIYSLDLRDGHIQKGPVVVDGAVGGQNFVQHTQGWKQLRKQRAGLLLANGLVYAAFGGDNPHALAGWLFVYDAATLTLKTVWSPTPNGRNGGIWQSGQGLSADNKGNVFLQTGDGDFLPSKQSFGNALLRLRMNNGAIAVDDFFAPCNQMILQKCDLDQGSAGPVLFNGFVVGGGKDGELFLMRADNLAKYKPGPFPPTALTCEPGTMPGCTDGPDLIQSWQGTMGHIHGAPVIWPGPGGSLWLYVMGEGDHLNAFPFNGATFDIGAIKQSKWSPPHPAGPFCAAIHHWMPGGILSVTSNGTAPHTGIVWVLTPANGDANSCRGVKGMLMAFNAENVTDELWRSQGRDVGLSDTSDSFGLLARFTPPTIAEGKVFVATAGDTEPLQRWPGPRPAPGPANYRLVVYGLR